MSWSRGTMPERYREYEREMKMNAKKKMLIALGLAGGIAAYLAATTEPSDWRYAKLLATNLPRFWSGTKSISSLGTAFTTATAFADVQQ